MPKRGNSLDEYEDAYFPTATFETEARSFRAAVADGATETSFAGEWARLLVRSYVRRRFRPLTDSSSINRSRGRWRTAVTSTPLPWYAEEKRRLGAFAAFVGLTIDHVPGHSGASERRSWTVAVAGDACLFHIRGDAIIASFPFDDPDMFSNHPELLSSIESQNIDRMVSSTIGEWKSGDTFLLATDALAQWVLSQLPNGHHNLLNAMCDTGVFETLIENERDQATLRNDDVTAVVVEVSES
jgi:serine/threonine protein phosphatase PrpC